MNSRQRILACCRAMEAAGGPLPLKDLGSLVFCSARQVQRDFDAIGVSPLAYGRAVRTDAARASLRRADSVSDAVHDAGYGSVRAFYEEAGRRLGMTPTQYAARGADVPLLWATTPSAVGVIIAAASPSGLVAVRIGADRAMLIKEIVEEFPSSELTEDPEAMSDVLLALRALARGDTAPDLPLDVRGTAFQARVWEALRRIPHGATTTYTDVAESLDAPHAVRAVAGACAHNRVALVVPCHRVLRRDGSLAGYAWGLEVKEQLLEAEASSAG